MGVRALRADPEKNREPLCSVQERAEQTNTMMHGHGPRGFRTGLRGGGSVHSTAGQGAWGARQILPRTLAGAAQAWHQKRAGDSSSSRTLAWGPASLRVEGPRPSWKQLTAPTPGLLPCKDLILRTVSLPEN